MTEAPRIYTASVLIIGNEILSGRTKDANLPYLATRLNALGIRLAEARVIPDVLEVIAVAVNDCRARHDYLFTTGGIGPTHDDITADAVALAFGVDLEYHPEALAILESQYKKGDLNEARKRMARVPKGGGLVHNPVSMAPGLRMDNVFILAGVPMIMQAQFESIAHELVGGEPMLTRAVAAHLPEGAIAEGLGRIQGRYADVDIGSYPYYRQGRFGTSIVLRSTDAGLLVSAGDEVAALMRDLGAQPIEETG